MRLLSPVLQVAPQPPRHGREEHVVDRPAQRLSHRLDLLQRQGRRPRDPLGHAERPPEGRPRIAPAEEQAAEAAGRRGPGQPAPGGAEGLRRIEQQLHALGHDLLGQRADRRQVQVVLRRRGEEMEERIGHRRVRFGGAVGQREQDEHQRDAVAHAVMEASHHHGPAAVVVEEQEVPHRAVQVELLRDQPFDGLAELRIPPGIRQDDVADVVIEVEIRVGLPVGPPPLRHHHPPVEARDGEQPASDDLPEPLQAHRLGQDENPIDVHEVRRIVHPQPGEVDAGKRFAALWRHLRLTPARGSSRGPSGWSRCRTACGRRRSGSGSPRRRAARPGT